MHAAKTPHGPSKSSVTESFIICWWTAGISEAALAGKYGFTATISGEATSRTSFDCAKLGTAATGRFLGNRREPLQRSFSSRLGRSRTRVFGLRFFPSIAPILAQRLVAADTLGEAQHT